MYILPASLASVMDKPSRILARQDAATTTIVSTATPQPGCSGQYSGGVLAGAILGTFFGTLLLVYMFSVIRANAVLRTRGAEEVIVEKRTSRRHKSRSGRS